MRVTFIIKSHLDVSTWLIAELSKLVELHVVFVVAGDRHQESCYDFDLSDLSPGLTERVETVSALLGDAWPLFSLCKSVAFFKLPSWSMKAPANIRHACRMATHLRQLAPDVIHFNGSVGMLHPLYYLLTPGIPKVQSIHDSAPHSGERNWKKICLQRFLVRKAHRITLFSHFCRTDLLGIYPSLSPGAIDVIPLGPIPLTFGTGRTASKVNRDSHHILFWGRISPYKGLDDLAEAFPLVRKQVPQARLTIAGNGDLGASRDHLQSMDGVTVLNRYIHNDELLEMVESAAFGVLPYTDATQSGVAMVAFAHGLPLIVSDVGALSEVVSDGETGLLTPPRNPEALASAMVRLLGDDGLQRDLAMNIGKACSDEFGWRVAAKKYVAVYEKARFRAA